VVAPVLAIVAGLSIQDVRERPSADAPQGVRDEAERMHARFADPTSDFLSILNLWNHLREQQKELGSSVPPALPLGAPELRARARVVRRAPAAADARAPQGVVERARAARPRRNAAISRGPRFVSLRLRRCSLNDPD
jgi:hypothetical protein